MRPKKCCYPNCTECPYKDCRYDDLTARDYTISNQRDYEHYEDYNGVKLHVASDSIYRNARQSAYNRERNRVANNNKEYLKEYYKNNREKLCKRAKEKYDTKKNTRHCRKYRKNNKEHMQRYYKEYYERNKQKILERAKKRYEEKKKLN